MKSITFISFEQNYYDKHQFYCLAAYLKSKGFKVSYINENRFDKVMKRLDANKPDLLGYSSFSANSAIYIEFDKLQKKTFGITSIIGGPGAIFEPESFSNTTIDGICIGEGEYALEQYMQTDGNVANNMIIKGNNSLPVRYNPLIDLDKMPFPEREIVYDEEPYLKKMKYRMFLSGRGCPYRCTYCHNHLFNDRFKHSGKIVRKKSVDYFIEEIREVNVKYKPFLMVMQDDTFILDKMWLLDFCYKYKRIINKPFGCNIRANIVDEDIIRALKEGGCVCCNWSIESGNDNIRNKILKRNMTKEQIIHTADLLNKYGIKHRIGNLIGIPQETYDDVKETIELNIRCKPNLALANTLIPFPGLDITDYAIKSGWLCLNRTGDLPDVISSMTVLNFSRKDKGRLRKTVFLFPLFVHFPMLYRKLIFRNILYKIPTLVLKYSYAMIDMFSMANLYRFNATFADIVSIIVRYMRYSISREKLQQ